MAETINSYGDIVKPTSINGYKWSYCAQETGYTASSDLVILRFSAKVNDDAVSGGKSITLKLETCFDNTLELNELTTKIIPATVTVENTEISGGNGGENGNSNDGNTGTQAETGTQNIMSVTSPKTGDTSRGNSVVGLLVVILAIFAGIGIVAYKKEREGKVE